METVRGRRDDPLHTLRIKTILVGSLPYSPRPPPKSFSLRPIHELARRPSESFLLQSHFFLLSAPPYSPILPIRFAKLFVLRTPYETYQIVHRLRSLTTPFLRYLSLSWRSTRSSPPHSLSQKMDNWRVAVLGDGGVGKTALAVQVSFFHLHNPVHPGIIVLPSLHSIVLLVSNRRPSYCVQEEHSLYSVLML